MATTNTATERKQIAVMVSRDTHARIASHAAANGTGVSAAVEALIARGLNGPDVAEDSETQRLAEKARKREASWRACRAKRRAAGKE